MAASLINKKNESTYVGMSVVVLEHVVGEEWGNEKNITRVCVGGHDPESLFGKKDNGLVGPLAELGVGLMYARICGIYKKCRKRRPAW
jgi:hypothetical protein